MAGSCMDQPASRVESCRSVVVRNKNDVFNESLNCFVVVAAVVLKRLLNEMKKSVGNKQFLS